MKAKIYIKQNAALKAGSNNHGEYDVEFDPAEMSEAHRKELITCRVSGNVYDTTVMDSFYKGDWGTNIVTVNLESLRTILDARIIHRKKEIEKQKKQKIENLNKHQKIIEELAKLPMEDRIYLSIEGKDLLHTYKLKAKFIDPIDTYHNDIKELAKNNAAYMAAIEEAKIEAERMTKQIQAKVDQKRNDAIKRYLADESAKIKLDHKGIYLFGDIIIPNGHPQIKNVKAEHNNRLAKAKKRRSTQITTWVEKHGTQSQKDRLKENLLPETEIIDAIRSATYAPLDDWPRYNKLTTSDVCNCEYDYCDVDFDVDDKESATEKEFEQLQKIKKLMPKATIELREHTGQSEDCNNTVRRTGFMVRMTVGEFEFSREYGLKTETD